MAESFTGRRPTSLLLLLILSEALYLPAQPQNLWLLLLCAGAAAVVVFWLLRLCFRGRDLLAASGFWGGLLRIVVLLLCLYAIWDDTARLSLFFSKTAFPSLPRAVTGAITLLAALGLSLCGRAALPRWAFPTAIVLAVPLLLSMALTASRWQLSQLRPALPPDETFPLAVLACFLRVYLPLLFLFLLYPDRRARSFTPGILLGGMLLSLTAARNLMLLGAHTATKVPYPTYAAAGIVSIGDFFQRAEALIAGCLTLCVLAHLTVLMLTAWRCLLPLCRLLPQRKTGAHVR